MEYVNSKIRGAKPGTALHGVELVEDPSDKLIEVYLQALEWEMQQRKFNMTARDLAKLQEMSCELLDILKSNMPEKSGEQEAWKFEKEC